MAELHSVVGRMLYSKALLQLIGLRLARSEAQTFLDKNVALNDLVAPRAFLTLRNMLRSRISASSVSRMKTAGRSAAVSPDYLAELNNYIRLLAELGRDPSTGDTVLQVTGGMGGAAYGMAAGSAFGPVGTVGGAVIGFFVGSGSAEDALADLISSSMDAVQPKEQGPVMNLYLFTTMIESANDLAGLAKMAGISAKA